MLPRNLRWKTSRSTSKQIKAYLSTKPSITRPASLPKPVPDVKHIRLNPELYKINCQQRNYPQVQDHGWVIHDLHVKWLSIRKADAEILKRNKAINKQLGDISTSLKSKSCEPNRSELEKHREELLEQVRQINSQVDESKSYCSDIEEQIHDLALQVPNLSSPIVPDAEEFEVVEYLNIPAHSTKDDLTAVPEIKPKHTTSHVDIGTYLDIIALAPAASISGTGFYFLKGAGALLEQALISYALSQATAAGFVPVAPPTLVYQYVANAAGYQPRDANGEQQIYEIAQVQTQPQSSPDTGTGTDARPASSPNHTLPPRLVLTGTSEIALAAMHAGQSLAPETLPLKYVGVSRCYRAEAGGRGRDTKGLYRVHEFSKVELFAWTAPDNWPAMGDRHFDTVADVPSSSSSSSSASTTTSSSKPSSPTAPLPHTLTSTTTATTTTTPPTFWAQPSAQTFLAMLALQKRILQSLDLPLRVLNMGARELGASATAKFDVECYFPSRGARPGADSGAWGEVASLSMCADYQSRRMFTRVGQGVGGGGGGVGGNIGSGNRTVFPYTLNGTALAVPRVLAAILENGWDEERKVVKLPECLHKYMGCTEITKL